jgi:hypothetical protein
MKKAELYAIERKGQTSVQRHRWRPPDGQALGISTSPSISVPRLNERIVGAGERRLSVAELLGSSVFRFFAFPVGSAAAGVLLKCVTRNDRYAFFKKEDIAVGPQIMLTAVLMFVLQSSDRARALVQMNQAIADALAVQPPDNAKIASLEGSAQAMSQQLLTATLMIPFLVVGLWGVSTIIKRWGWQSEAELKPVVGITIPLLFGVASLFCVMLVAPQ